MKLGVGNQAIGSVRQIVFMVGTIAIIPIIGLQLMPKFGSREMQHLHFLLEDFFSLSNYAKNR